MSGDLRSSQVFESDSLLAFLDIDPTGASLADDFRILPSANATALGLSVTPNQLTVDENGLRISTTDQSAIGIEAAAESLVSEHISLRNLPSEELIVILTGGGTRRLSAQFDHDARVAVETTVGVVVTDVIYHPAHDLFDVDLGFGGFFARD